MSPLLEILTGIYLLIYPELCVILLPALFVSNDYGMDRFYPLALFLACCCAPVWNRFRKFASYFERQE